MSTVDKLQEIVGQDWVITNREQMERYLADETADAVRPKPADNVILVKPKSAEEIAAILKMANQEKTPVFVRGGGTGICGGAVPIADGILVSMERLDRIDEVDRDNLMVVAEAGVPFGNMLKAVEEAGLFFPPHPGDEGAHVGGLVACNAGGTRAVKYGVIRNFVRGLEVVLPTGEIITTGGKLLKNNQGFDLMHLFINSGGALGVITKVIFRLCPKFNSSGTLVVSYDSRHKAIDTVPQILQSGITPMAIEYVERDVIEISARRLSMTWPATKGQAYLIVILIGDSEDEVYSQGERVSDICERNNAVDILIAERREEQANILKIRSEVYSSLKPTIADVLDITVPPASIGVMMDRVDEIAKRYDVKIPTYGHAADGNLHPHLMVDLAEKGILREVKRAIYQEAVKLGGVITGEHGLGVIRLADLDLCPDGKTWELMRGIKRVFDPNNILSPGVGVL
ncbi:MAG: FAD-binding protein [Dehalococcoidia bacterium]|nr:MAG: FAD-binding protein [Dehalococcoidia bacterium]